MLGRTYRGGSASHHICLNIPNCFSPNTECMAHAPSPEVFSIRQVRKCSSRMARGASGLVISSGDWFMSVLSRNDECVPSQSPTSSERSLRPRLQLEPSKFKGMKQHSCYAVWPTVGRSANMLAGPRLESPPVGRSVGQPECPCVGRCLHFAMLVTYWGTCWGQVSVRVRRSLPLSWPQLP